MVEIVENLYEHSGAWGDPILITVGILFIAGWFMMFTVRLVKRFVLFTALALVLPNAIGFIGYLEEADSIQEAVVERGEEMGEEVGDAIDDLEFSPLYLSLMGSVLAAAVGVAGIVRTSRAARRSAA